MTSRRALASTIAMAASFACCVIAASGPTVARPEAGQHAEPRREQRPVEGPAATGRALVRAPESQGVLLCQQPGGFTLLEPEFDGELLVEGLEPGRLDVFLRVAGRGTSWASIKIPAADADVVTIDLGPPQGGRLAIHPQGGGTKRPFVRGPNKIEWLQVLERTGVGEAVAPALEQIPGVPDKVWMLQDLPPGRYTVEVPGRYVQWVDIADGKITLTWR